MHADLHGLATHVGQLVFQRVEDRPELPDHGRGLVRGIHAERQGQVGLCHARPRSSHKREETGQN